MYELKIEEEHEVNEVISDDNVNGALPDVRQDSQQREVNNNKNTTASFQKKIMYDVSFTAQAPSGQWNIPEYQDGCEEASILMAMRWVEGEGLTSAEAEQEIIALSEFQEMRYGTFHDRSTKDTAQLIRDYYDYDNIEYREEIESGDIKEALFGGSLVIIPANGRKLGNPYFTPPGPINHMLLVIGYDPVSKQFIVNDPGTKRGNGYRYDESKLQSAIRDYPTGLHESILKEKTAMIIVREKQEK